MDIFVMALLVSVAINLSMFLVAFWLQSDKLTDISYAATFAVIALWAFAVSHGGAYHLILLAMVVLWALRLGGFLLYRVIKKGKDSRFDDMRHDFIKFGRFWLVQAITVWVMMLPSVFAAGVHPVLSAWSFVGIVVWALGLACETVADMQKLVFHNDPSHKGAWIDSGIWRYSRHPNYFGEILVWLGVYIYAINGLSPLHMLISAVSPLFITVLLLFVSGIPILEKSADHRWGTLPAYRRYKKRTSILVPLPKRP